MKELEYRRCEDESSQLLINEEKPIWDDNVLLIHGWEEELKNEKFGESVL